MKNNILIVFCLITLSYSGQISRLKFANKMYDEMSYYEASVGYEDVLDRGIDSIEVGSKIANCYFQTENLIKADAWYTYLDRKGLITKSELLTYSLIKRELGEYKESENIANKYFDGNSAADNLYLFLKNQSEGIKNEVKGQGFKLYTQDINTEMSEISATKYNQSSVLVSSSKRVSGSVNRQYSWDGTYFYNLYKAEVDSSGDIKKMKLLKGEVNTKYHDGPAVYHLKSNKVYFTRNNYINGKKGNDENKIVRLKLYSGELINNKIKNVIELPLNSDEHSCAHASISEDGKWLFFSSDMSGGFGGADIYKVEVLGDNKFGTPINLGNQINTPQDELFPFYHSKDNVLFVSSEGHSGYGGLDIFLVKLTNSLEVKSVENLGASLNSNRDDFSFTTNETQSKGYICSNREKGEGKDDIYKFDQFQRYTSDPILKGSIQDLVKHFKIEGADILIKDAKGNVIYTLKSDMKGNFEVPLVGINDDFTISTSKPGYENNIHNVKFNPEADKYEEIIDLTPNFEYFVSGQIIDKFTNSKLNDVNISLIDNENRIVCSTVSSENGDYKTEILKFLKYRDTFNIMIKFEKIGYVTETYEINSILDTNENVLQNAILTKIVVGVTDLADIIDLKPIYFDYNKFDIRTDAAIELNKVVKLMNENPSLVIELGSHTDSRGTDASNLVLSQKRARASANYIISQGISADRIYGKGYGEKKLKISDSEIQQAKKMDEKEKLHELNRRTEFIIVKTK